MPQGLHRRNQTAKNQETLQETSIEQYVLESTTARRSHFPQDALTVKG